MKTVITLCTLLLSFIAAVLPLPAQGSDAAYYGFTRDDMRLCPSPACGGIFVKSINRILTRCLDGTFRFECYVAGVDLSALSLGEAESVSFMTLFSRGLGIVKGTFRPLAFEGSGPGLVHLVAEEV